MATLNIEISPSENLQQCTLRFDDNPDEVVMNGNQGSDVVTGTCGDGSRHLLFYTLLGPVGAKLDIKILCNGSVRLEIPLEVFPPGPVMHGDVEFFL